MEFGIEKCDMLIMKIGKRESAEGTELTNPGCIRTLGKKKNYNNMSNFGNENYQVSGKNKKRVPQKNNKYSRNQEKFHQRNKHQAVPFRRYSGLFLKWTREERKTNYSDQKLHNQHNNQQKNNKEAEMKRKTTAWIFQTTNKGNLTRENLVMASKGKS